MIADFLQTSLPEVKDTVNIQKATAEFIETLATTPADQLISQFAEKAIAFGLKVLAALAIYLIGAWLIRKIKKIIHGIFIRRNTEHAIASFVESITSITLTVFLVIITFAAAIAVAFINKDEFFQIAKILI